jgi:hypothetical protein
MPRKNSQAFQRSAQVLSIIALVILAVGCSGVGFSTPPPIPSSKLSRGPHPRNLIGNWQGCIQSQGGGQPKETMSLKVFEEKADGTFLGIYNEDYQFDVPLSGGDDRFANNVLTSNAQIDQNNNVQFSALVQRNLSGNGQNNEETDLYAFKGVLVDIGIMEGQVTQSVPDSPGVIAHTFGWELSENGSNCLS